MKNSKTMKKILISTLSLSAAVSAVAIPMITMTSCKKNTNDDGKYDANIMSWGQAKQYFNVDPDTGLVTSVKSGEASKLLKAAQDEGFEGIGFKNVRLGEKLFSAGEGVNLFKWTDGVFHLKEVQIIGSEFDPSALTVGEECFKGCTGLVKFNSYDLESGLFIGNEAFSGCTRLGSRGSDANNTIFADNGTEIGDKAFFNCTSLYSIMLPELKKVGTSAFEGCTSLNVMGLGRVKEISNFAFKGCTNVTHLMFTYRPEEFSAVPAPTDGVFAANAFDSFSTVTSDVKTVKTYCHRTVAARPSSDVLNWLKSVSGWALFTTIWKAI